MWANECDKCVYIKDTKNCYVTLYLYIDDILIVDSNDKIIKFTKNILTLRFDVKDIRYANVILGVKILKTSNRLILSQSHYVR